MKKALRALTVPSIAAAIAASLATSCSTRKAGLMLAITSDLVPGKDFDGVTLEVSANGVSVLSKNFTIGKDATKLPLTFSVVEGSNPGPRVRVRAIATKSGQARITREANVVLVGEETKLVRLPLDWLAEAPASACPDGKTSIQGTCATSDVVNLPAYREEDVFGRGTVRGDGACFDVAACFAQAETASPDKDCTVALPSGAAGLNVGLIPSSGGDGVCSAGRCVVSLSEGTEGFHSLGNGRIELPAAACKAGRISSILVSGACETRSVTIPPCSDATLVNGQTIRPSVTIDGGSADADATVADATPDAPIDAPVDAPSDADAGVVIPFGDGGVSVASPVELVSGQGVIRSVWNRSNEVQFGLDTGEIKGFDRSLKTIATHRPALGSGWTLWARNSSSTVRGQESGRIDVMDFYPANGTVDMTIVRSGVKIDALTLFVDDSSRDYVAWSESLNGTSTLYKCLSNGNATCTPEVLGTFTGTARSMTAFEWDFKGIVIATKDGRVLSCIGACTTPQVIYSDGTGDQISQLEGTTNVLRVVDQSGKRLRQLRRTTGTWSVSDVASLTNVGTTVWPETISPSVGGLFYLATTLGVFASDGPSSSPPWLLTLIGSPKTATCMTATFDELLVGTSEGRVLSYKIGP